MRPASPYGASLSITIVDAGRLVSGKHCGACGMTRTEARGEHCWFYMRPSGRHVWAWC